MGHIGRMGLIGLMSRMGLMGHTDIRPCEVSAHSSGKLCQFAFAALFCYENFGAPKHDGWI
jgi:hypothetical protein